MTVIGLIVPPDQPPERLHELAVSADGAELAELWLWEDCFAQSGVAPAAAVLAWTEQIRVGIGLLPVPLRNVALTAMELATLERLFPGRCLPGIGHGVLSWMGQAGVRERSPMTLLREHAQALRGLLAGGTITTSGRYVRLDDVTLRWPPALRPPVLVGAVGPKTMALAGEVGDGVIFTDAGPDEVRTGLGIARAAREAAGIDEPFEVVAFLSVPVAASAVTITAHARELADAGATRIAVCGLSPAGPPEGGALLLELIPALQVVRDELA